MTKGGGYYIDVGCSQLITSSKIKVIRCAEGIAGFEATGVRLADNNFIPADVVVLATGYDNMRTSCRKILGDEIADAVSDVWDLDDEGELNGVSLFSPPFSILFHTKTWIEDFTDQTDVATFRPPSLLVYGRKPRSLQDLQQIPGFAD